MDKQGSVWNKYDEVFNTETVFVLLISCCLSCFVNKCHDGKSQDDDKLLEILHESHEWHMLLQSDIERQSHFGCYGFEVNVKLGLANKTCKHSLPHSFKECD